MSPRRRLAAALLALAALSVAPASAFASAPATPAWGIQALAAPTNFKPGGDLRPGSAEPVDVYEAFFTNSGGEATDGGKVTITDTLPPGLGVQGVELLFSRQKIDIAPSACEADASGAAATVTCIVEEGVPPAAEEPATLYPSEALLLKVHVTVPASATGPLANRVAIEGGGAEPASATAHNQALEEGGERVDAPAGLQGFRAALTGADGKPATGADSRPFEQTTSFATSLNLSPPGAELPFVPAGGNLKGIEVALPPGLVGNPASVTRCTAQQFNTTHGITVEGINNSQNECPDSAAVGVAQVRQLEGVGNAGGIVPLYNLVPPPGMPAQLGFQIADLPLPIYINTRLRSDGDYGITAYLPNTAEVKRVTAAQVTIWGAPGDPRHDRLRGQCAKAGGSCPADMPSIRPFLRLPSSCANPLTTTMRFDTWLHPGAFVSTPFEEPAPTACSRPDFSPTIEAKPSTDVADAPSGLHVALHLPQAANEDPEGLGEADLRDATVTLPPGLSVNPSSADGLGACSLSEIGYEGIKEGRHSFSAGPPECPDASKIGTVEVDSPLVDHPLPGAIYLARQGENPFGSLLALYLTVDDPQTGVVIKLPGKVEADPVTGQITNSFEQNPQLPFESLEVDLFQGARAPLRTPQTCGAHSTATSLVPWSAPEGATAHPSDSFSLTTAPGGGPCAAAKAQLPNAPSFEAGTATPLAGAYSPFLLRLKREDGSQELKGLNVSLPAGLTARLAGTAECPAAGVAQAQSRSNPGQGALEQASPSCPASSQLGTVTVGAGAGPSPFHAQGKAYLAGPYKGAPLSMLVITPAVAGPFDLGSVAVRAALNVDPESTKVTVLSDPIPTILQGIPLDVRSIAVRIDKPSFTLNPTSCEVKALTAQATSTEGSVAALQNRFQVGGCASLGFRPSLSLRLKGATKRGAHPALTATLTYPSKGAYSNIAKAQVALPHSEFLDTTHIKTICTRVQFAAAACPAGAIYGYAKAITPLLDKPLEGPVYLRSSSNPLPDLVADLNGQIHVVLAGRVDSVHGGTRNSFEAVPDAPVTRFTLSLPAGRKGLLQNSTDVCRGTHKATARFTAHNGKAIELRPQLRARCKGKAEKRHGHRRRHGAKAPHHRPRP